MLKTIKVSLLLVLSISMCIIPLYAQTDSVGGGSWDHGSNCSTVWSNYSHSTKEHKSSVENYQGYTDSSGWKAAAVKSKANLNAKCGPTDYAYYDYR